MIPGFPGSSPAEMLTNLLRDPIRIENDLVTQVRPRASEPRSTVRPAGRRRRRGPQRRLPEPRRTALTQTASLPGSPVGLVKSLCRQRPAHPAKN
eukprot:763165-Hanusia_phi.AAC.1